MGTLNLGHAGANLIPLGEVDFTVSPELPRQITTHYLKRTNRVSVRLRDEDISCLQEKATESGVPLQSYIAEVLHKFANGGLAEK